MIKKLLTLFTESTLHFEGKEADEEVLLILRQHPFIIIARLAIFLFLALVPVVAWYVYGNDVKVLAPYTHLFWFFLSLWYLTLWFLSFYTLTIYTLNVVVITNKRIIESEQYGFFNRKISELHVFRIQDISVRTYGMIGTMLKFGDIEVQTAASEKQFTFRRIANPEEVKDTIMSVVSHSRANMRTA